MYRKEKEIQKRRKKRKNKKEKGIVIEILNIVDEI